MQRTLTSLVRCTKGATLVEFAFVAPVFILMLCGIVDISHTLYTSSVMQGVLQKAGRDFTLENAAGRRDSIETWVSARIANVAPSAEVTYERKAYFDFGDVGEPEAFDDLNNNGLCDANEPFEDANGNGQWDDDQGKEGGGGARDAVLFTATAKYRRLLPMMTLAGFPEYVTLQASTVLRNQPYDAQDRVVETENCG